MRAILYVTIRVLVMKGIGHFCVTHDDISEIIT